MKKYKVIIEGVTPYMQHRMDDQKLEAWEKQRGPIHERPDVAHETTVRAEYHCQPITACSDDLNLHQFKEL
jgi:stress response protein YsnF